MRKIINLISIFILICVFGMIAITPKSPEKIWEENIKDLEQQKTEIIQLIEQKKIEYAEKEQELVEIHNDAEKLREMVKQINQELYWNPETDKVMDKICELSKESPMCWDWEMLNDLIQVANQRQVDYKLLLGIMYAESHIWINFKPYKCNITNNWAWLKGRKYDDRTMSEWYNEQYQNLNLDLEGCWLYYFEDIHTFFESLANTISLWYSKCNEDVYCIMKSYVWHESGAWVRNVYLFKSL